MDPQRWLTGIVSLIVLGIKGRDSRIGSSLRRGCAGVQPCNRTAHLSKQQTMRIEQNRSNLHTQGLNKPTVGNVLYSYTGEACSTVTHILLKSHRADEAVLNTVSIKNLKNLPLRFTRAERAFYENEREP
jgi:hypothetical protein